MEVIADYQDLCGECPVWDPETGTLYWTDNSGHRFYRYRPATGVHEVLDDKLEICGFRLNEGGGFTIINSGGRNSSPVPTATVLVRAPPPLPPHWAL